MFFFWEKMIMKQLKSSRLKTSFQNYNLLFLLPTFVKTCADQLIFLDFCFIIYKKKLNYISFSDQSCLFIYLFIYL